jgi:hypothetical protein
VILVEMYPLRVTRQFDTWPEQGHRHRHWAVLREARRLLAEPGLVELANLLARRALAEDQPASARISA